MKYVIYNQDDMSSIMKRKQRLKNADWNDKILLVKKLVKEGMPINEARRISGLDQLLRVG
jgi:hypothetical protein